MEYNFREIEQKWQQQWKDTGAYKVDNNFDKPKYYVLDMFPYPSGAGLHVGHPLGYIASDIFSRYKRLKGFNVLHPMGFDSFGLPAEQYALETGQHPAETTKKNIATFKNQLDKIGFCYDWSREVQTSDPNYYKWTQKIFLDLFNSYFCNTCKQAKPISELVKKYETRGGSTFTADDWSSYPKAQQEEILMKRRLAFSSYGEVNWCEALGTVLANDEVVNGVSERGGHPVVKKKMRQWYLRITAYADRLLEGLERVDFSESMKEMQRNWIGRSEGAEVNFDLTPGPRGATSPQPISKGEGQESAANESEIFSPGGEQAFRKTSPQPFYKGEVQEDASKTSVTKDVPPAYITNTVEQWKMLSAFAQENRKHATEAEAIIWEQVRYRKIADYKFRRQHPIAGYIPDFVCLDKKLIIEIDGGYHNEAEQQQFDIARTAWLAEHGYTMLRFTNDEVENDLTNVLQKIEKELNEIKPIVNNEEPSNAEQASASPLSFGEGPGVRSILGGEDQQQATRSLRVYTTRPDTIFGVDFMVLAPEHELVQEITTDEQREEIEKYLTYVKGRSDRERQAEVKSITGAFTGAYAINPFNGVQIPVWISEYVLAGYGTGAIMAVPCGDERDFKFARHFDITITNIIGEHFNGNEANPTKDAVLQNSGFLNGLLMKDAIGVAIDKIEELGIGKRKVNYKMRDAGFSRQRYWGEPFPILWKDGVATPLSESTLPLELPHVEKYGPGPEGEGPLANIDDWVNTPEGRRETSTMPGYAGSSWYFLRYMDPHNSEVFVDRKASDYWNSVDLYIGGTEHAVGHLLYSRMWTKVLYDLGYIGFDEPFQKLLNQGMIQGSSRFVYRVTPQNYYTIGSANTAEVAPVFISKNFRDEINGEQAGLRSVFVQASQKNVDNLALINNYIEKLNFNLDQLHVDVKFVDGIELDMDAFRKWRPEYADAIFICEDGTVNYPNNNELDRVESPLSNSVGEGPGVRYLCGAEVEKMSKSKYNTVNPDELCEKYGADTFRMYEMFLGPVEQSKPWDTKGIEGVHRFLRKLWRLFFDEIKGNIFTEEKATAAELKVLHKTIKKIEDDTERFSFNTAVSTFMIAVNELGDLKCNKREILEPMVVLLVPYAPHIAEELWHQLGNESSVLDAAFPAFNEIYVTESSKEYPISINGKVRSSINLPLDATQPNVEAQVIQNEVVQKWLEGKSPKKIIFVKGKMINVVI